jgi:hypothetical protein
MTSLPTDILLEDIQHIIPEAEVRSPTCACIATPGSAERTHFPFPLALGLACPCITAFASLSPQQQGLERESFFVALYITSCSVLLLEDESSAVEVTESAWLSKARCNVDLVQVRCIMCSPDEMVKLAPIIRDCTCLKSIVIMDR